MLNLFLLAILRILPALILLLYGFRQGKIRVYFDMLMMAFPAALFYGVFMSMIPNNNSYFYFLAKFALFVMPTIVIISKTKYRLRHFGVTNIKLKQSIKLGLLFLIITAITNAIIFKTPVPLNINTFFTFSIPMFLDAFNEEFLFRGIFFLFALRHTKNLPLSYIVSLISAFAWHPFELARMIPVFVQGTLMCIILYKTKNIYGAWVSHGLNRTLASIIPL